MLISCVAYQDGTKLGDIPIAQIPEYAISLLFMGAIDVYLYFRFKKAKWL
jgi:hypothetical protein